MSNPPTYNCTSEEMHTPHLYFENQFGIVVKCWGWTHEDEFFKIIDREWANWGEKHYGYE